MAGPSASTVHTLLSQTQLSVAAPHTRLLLILYTTPLTAEQTASPQPDKDKAEIWLPHLETGHPGSSPLVSLMGSPNVGLK